MRALTLIRPWPFAVCHLGKDVENRSWPPPRDLWGEDLAIHAGQKTDPFEVERLRRLLPEISPALYLPDDGGPTGVVAVVRLCGVADTKGRDYFELSASSTRADWALCASAMSSRWRRSGHVGWVFSEVRVLPRPIRCSGAQGVWALRPDVDAAVRHQLRTLEDSHG